MMAGPEEHLDAIDLSVEQLVPARNLIGCVAGALATDSRRDAGLLVGLALDRDEPVYGHQDIVLSRAQADRLAGLIAARRAGQPVSRLRGRREFWSLNFYLNKATLDPRADSEVLIEAALHFIAERRTAQPAGTSVLDLGTGTGCLLLSLLSELPEATGLGVDLAPLAVAQARANAAALAMAGRARFETGDWASGLGSQFDIIFSNPPYICEGDDSLCIDVAGYDPALALFAGADGLSAYRALLPQLGGVLASDGAAFVEVGAGQCRAVSAIASDAGLTLRAVRRDLAGIERCLVLVK